jgi:hypothetical protein
MKISELKKNAANEICTEKVGFHDKSNYVKVPPLENVMNMKGCNGVAC